MARNQTIPWEEIRLKYVTSPGLSLAQIVREYGISYGNLHRRSKREQWKAAREKFVAETAEAIKERTRKELAEVGARHLVEGAVQTRLLLCRYYEKLLANLTTDAESEVAEERQVATKASGGVIVRRETRRKRSVVEIGMYTRLLQAETDRLKVLLRADLDPRQVDRVIVID